MAEIQKFYESEESDHHILRQIGDFVKTHRLNQNLTQKKLAEFANISRGTIRQLENGGNIGLLNLIQVLRILQKLSVFDKFTLEDTISPLLLAKAQAKERKRASKTNELNEPPSTW